MTDPQRLAKSTMQKPPKRRHLPSLGALASFEVAAKHLSFTLAGAELNVTQAAISQQIRSLEQALDCRLFIRKHNAMELTPEGFTLLEGVSNGLDRLSDAIFRINQRGERDVITISSTYAAISHYIKPLVDRFSAAHPGIRFTLLASDENDRLQNFEEVDLAIICGNERAEIGHHLIRLFPEVVDPVCTPRYRDKIGLETPEDLLRADLLELHRMHWSSEAISWYPLGWSDWFRAHLPHLDCPDPTFFTNSYGTLMRAAMDDQGVLLGWRHLVDERARRGELVPLFAHPLNTQRSYYLKINPSARDNPHIENLIAFIQDDIAKTPSLHDGT